LGGSAGEIRGQSNEIGSRKAAKADMRPL